MNRAPRTAARVRGPLSLAAPMLLAGTLLLAVRPAAAAGPVQAPESIRAAAVAAARAALAALGGEARIEGTTLDARLRLPRCMDALHAHLDRPAGARPTAVVSCSAPAAWTVRVPIRAQVWRPVVTLAQSLPRGSLVRAEHLRLAPMDLLALPGGYLTDPQAALGMQTTRALRADSPLAPAALAPPRLVRRGEPVAVLASLGTVSVRGQGVALQDGAEGARVQVRNPRSGRVVEGLVTAPGTITVLP